MKIFEIITKNAHYFRVQFEMRADDTERTFKNQFSKGQIKVKVKKSKTMKFYDLLNKSFISSSKGLFHLSFP